MNPGQSILSSVSPHKAELNSHILFFSSMHFYVFGSSRTLSVDALLFSGLQTPSQFIYPFISAAYIFYNTLLPKCVSVDALLFLALQTLTTQFIYIFFFTGSIKRLFTYQQQGVIVFVQYFFITLTLVPSFFSWAGRERIIVHPSLRLNSSILFISSIEFLFTYLIVKPEPDLITRCL